MACRTPPRARSWPCWRTGATARSSPLTIDRLRPLTITPRPAGGATMSRKTCYPFRLLAPLFLLALASGCGSGRYPVTGRVTYEDGTPVEGGTVIGAATVDGRPVGVQGNIEKDGTFRWGSDRPGDGAPPGNYRVLVMPVALGDSELAAGKVPAVDGKFTKYETSGITFDVKPGKNTLPITVTRPKPKWGGK